MTDLGRALVDIREIRRQVASTTQFQGYGPATLFLTALIAVAAGVAQATWLPEPAATPLQYAALWLGTAVLCSALIATQMLARANRLHAGMADEMIRHAVVQFLPMGATGAALPVLLLRVAPSTLWLMPGLWQILSGLGVFACRQCMPRLMVLAGAWFLFTGFCSIAVGAGHPLAPASMSLPYAAGMALIALIQHLSDKKGSSDENAEL